MSKLLLFPLLTLAVFVISACSEKKPNFLEMVSCDVENVSPDSLSFVPVTKFWTNTFTNCKSISSEKSRSGKYSVRIDEKNPYGMAYTINNVKAGDKYIVEVWRFSKDKSGSLVVQAQNTNDLYLIEPKSIETDKDGWEKIVLNCIVPDGFKGSSLKVYPWNQSSSYAYFDDMTIKYVEHK